MKEGNTAQIKLYREKMKALISWSFWNGYIVVLLDEDGNIVFQGVSSGAVSQGDDFFGNASMNGGNDMMNDFFGSQNQTDGIGPVGRLNPFPYSNFKKEVRLVF